MENLQSFLMYLASDIIAIGIYVYIFCTTLTLKQGSIWKVAGLASISFLGVIGYKLSFGEYNVAISFLVIFFICFIFYEEKLYFKLLVLIASLITQYLIEIFSLVILSMLRTSSYNDFYIKQNDFFILSCTLVFLSLTLLIHMLKHFKLIPSRINMSKLSKNHIISLCFILLITFFYSIFIDYLLGTNAKIQFNFPTSFLLFTLFMVVFLGGIIAVFIHKLLANNQLQITNDLMLKQLEHQLNHYRQLEKNIRETRKLKHDMNNHILCLTHLFETKQYETIGSFLTDIKTSIDTIESALDTGNSIVDAIINANLDRLNTMNIDFVFAGNLPASDFIKPIDLCIIVANSFDNSVEACMQIKDKHKRSIQIETFIKQKYWIYKIKNTCNPPITNAKGTLLTRKTDKENHGFGLLNIHESVTKYDGDFSCHFNEGYFILEIIVPLSM